MKLILIYLQKKIVVLNKIIPLIIIALFFTYKTNAQHLTNDVGLFVGPAYILGDFEQENNFQNKGLSVSLTHYLHFFNNNIRWNSNNEMLNKVALKTELNYTSLDLINRGKFSNRTSETAKKFKAMTGKVSMISMGMALEYYLKDLGEFLYPYNDEASFNPFLTLGFRYSLLNKNIFSDYGSGYDSTVDGDAIPANVLAPKYYQPGGIVTGSGKAFAITLGLGTRYKINEKFDAAVQGGWQVYLDDNVDALQVEEPANKFNDWTFNFQVGVVYHLNYAAPLRLF